jgi:sortase A
MRSDDHARAHNRRAKVLRWSERLFVIAGIVMIGWCTLVLADSGLSQWQARRSLEAVSLAASVAPPRITNRESAAPASAPKLHRGSAIGSLSIPKLDLGAVVLHGSDSKTLRHAPGHLENTALPGEAGNVVIAGHRDSFFRGLGEVIVGDDIFIDTTDRHLHYRVTATRVVNAHDVSVLARTDDAILTLITCYPFWVLGPAPDRFVVRATLVSETPFRSLDVPTSASHEPLVVRTPSVIEVSDGTVEDIPIRHDDTTLVRQVIERFRVTYNARLTSHNDVRPGGLLEFRSCDVAIAEHSAIARCATGSPPESADGAGVWTIRLDRADHGWATKTIASD